MGGRDEGVRRGDDLARHAQCLQRRQQGNGAVVEERDVLDTEVVGKSSFQFLVHRPAIGEDLVLPDVLQIGEELIQRRQIGLGDVNRFVVHTTSLTRDSRYWP
ncbi:hypothetical protein D3C78_1687460 [compost metagenome]